jgi:hypothetical protein
MEEKIKQLESEIEKEMEKCDKYSNQEKSLKIECTSFIIEELKEKIVKEIESFVKSDITNTNNLGLSKLSEMKKEMRDIIEDVDNSKDLLINNEKVWIITNEFTNNIDFAKGNIVNLIYNKKSEIMNNITEYMKQELIKIGNILENYNYISSKDKVNPRKYRYDYFAISSKSVLHDKIEQYNNIFGKYFESKEKLARLELDLDQTKALYLWEQA